MGLPRRCNLIVTTDTMALKVAEEREACAALAAAAGRHDIAQQILARAEDCDRTAELIHYKRRID